MSITTLSEAPTKERVRVGALAIELGYSCNQRCAYCYNPHRGGDESPTSAAPSRKPTTEILLWRLERLLESWQLGHVTLTGGEPLLHPALFPLLERLRDAGVARQVR